MDDITGKKFSLQDWVTRRAANQAGGIASRQNAGEAMQPFSIRKAVNGDNEILPSSPMQDVKPDSAPDMDAGPDMPAMQDARWEPVRSPDYSSFKSPLQKDEQKRESRVTMESLPKENMSKTDLKNGAGSGSPVQQLQIVRLLSDLGERLRQSEKEREIVWKELESCRKLIGDLDSKNSKAEQAYQSLQVKVTEKEDFIKGLLDKQKELEETVKAQTQTFETAKSEQESLKGKIEEKLGNIETVTGSAIIRIEDALVENNKLAKRVEQLSQDKVRLVRKLETMEEALTQTQESLKAKALVLLTDQALAAKTGLPQTPAWSGDDTLKISQPRAESVPQAAGPVSDIAASLRKQALREDISNKAFIAALVVLVLASVLLLGQMNIKFLPDFSADADKVGSAVTELQPEKQQDQTTIIEPASAVGEPDQDILMADIARLANKIEPSVPASGGAVEAAPAARESGEFDKAVTAEDAALEKFKQDAPQGDVHARIKADKTLPKAIRAIEAKALDGDAKAQHDLAAVYTAGHGGVKVNYDLAAKWFTEAAHNNVANAQYNLGVLTQQGLGVEQDVGKAIDLYRVAAANGHPEAQYNLAIAYIEGVGAEYNPQIAAAYFQKAASGGIVEGAYNLGLLHENGLLGESQPDEAVFWYTLAADKGNEQAAAALGTLKTKLSMNDEDAARIVERIARAKPVFLNEDGKVALPGTRNSALTESREDSAEENAGQAILPDNNTVAQVQQQLREMGLYQGKADGKFSDDLEIAIRAYQKAHGMKQDGMVSEDLLVRILANETLQ